MTRIIVPLGGGGSAAGFGKVQVAGSNTYVDAPVYIGSTDPASSNVAEPYAWINSDTIGQGGTLNEADVVTAIGGKLWFGTQAAYTALATKDPGTLYVVL